MSLEVAALTVPILKIRKLTFRKEKLRGLPKITQLMSVELRFEPDRLNTKAHSRNHSFQRKEMGGGGWIWNIILKTYFTYTFGEFILG